MVKIFKVTESLDESCHLGSLRNIVRMATCGYKDHRTGHRRRAVDSPFLLAETAPTATEG